MLASPQMIAISPCRSDSWNPSAPRQYGSWSSSGAQPSYDHWRDHRWDEEWSSFLPQWGPRSAKNAMWDDRKAVDKCQTNPILARDAAFEVAGWEISRLARKVVPAWAKPQAAQTLFAQRDVSTGQSGRLPSVGSVGHADGSCKRCAFFPKGRCKNGEDCTHCHFEHPKPLRSRRRKRCAKGIGMDELFWNTSRMEEYMKDIDDASTQAGTTLASHSFIAGSVCKTTELDDEQRNDGLDNDSDMSDAESVPSSGEIGSDSAEEELVTAKETVGPKVVGYGHSASFITSADSWAERQRLCQMECESSASGVVQHRESKFMLANHSQHYMAAPAVLEPSAGSWAVQQRLRRAEREESTTADTPADVARKAKGILNKLTLERFESLCQQILDLPVHTAEQLAALVGEIFDKATTEKGFLTLYTELCARLDSHLLAEGSCVGGKVFRKALVTECQASFERNLQQPLDPKTLVNFTYEDRYVEEVKHKTRTLGNMRFIGELLIRKLLAGKILFFIVNEMLDTNSEASLESLVELLTVVSPVLERKGTIYEAPLRETFGTLRQKSKDKQICMRVRCKISDLLDFRSSGWAGKTTDLSCDKAVRGAALKR